MQNTSHEHSLQASTNGMTFDCLKTGLTFLEAGSKDLAAWAAYGVERVKAKRVAGVTQCKADDKSGELAEWRKDR